jgi:hypothetical protein
MLVAIDVYHRKSVEKPEPKIEDPVASKKKLVDLYAE